MLERIPRLFDLLALTGLAVIGAIVVAVVPKHDYGLMIAGTPLFFTASMLGVRSRKQRAISSDRQGPRSDE